MCAVLVAMFHFMAAGHFFWWPIVRSAYLFVDFFFVLSGFVMAHAYAQQLNTVADLKLFAVKRFARLWPLHVTILLFMVVMESMQFLVERHVGGAAFGGPYALTTILPNLLLIHSFGIFGSLSWNIPSWSISTEIVAYATFALLCLVFRPRMILAASIVSATSLLAVAMFSESYMDVTGEIGVCRCLFGFFLGYLVYRAHVACSARLSANFLLVCLAEIAAVAAVVSFVGGAGRDWPSLFAPFVFAWVVFLFSFEVGIISRLLRHRVCVMLGTVSYSLYMVHYPIFTVLRKITLWFQARSGETLSFDVAHWNGEAASMVVLDYGNKWIMDAVAIGFLATCFAVALLTHRFIEAPGRRFFDFSRRLDGSMSSRATRVQDVSVGRSWTSPMSEPAPAAHVSDRGT